MATGFQIERRQTPDGNRFTWRLIVESQVLACSPDIYRSREECRASIEELRRVAPTAPVDGDGLDWASK